MLQTYKAKLSEGILTWKDEVPESIREADNVDVIVTVLEADSAVSRRPFGPAKGEFTVPDDFDASLPDEIIEEFYRYCACCWIPTSFSGISRAIQRYRIPSAIRSMIRTRKYFLSVGSFWEILIKYELGKLPLPESPESYIQVQRRAHKN